MNILLICHEYPPLGGGGRQLMNLARAYAKTYAAYVLTVGFQQSGLCLHDGYTLHRLPAQRKHQVKPSNLEFLSFLNAAWNAIPAIARTFRPDVIHVFFSIPVAFSDWCWIFGVITTLLFFPVSISGIDIREESFIGILGYLGVAP